MSALQFSWHARPWDSSRGVKLEADKRFNVQARDKFLQLRREGRGLGRAQGQVRKAQALGEEVLSLDNVQRVAGIKPTDQAQTERLNDMNTVMSKAHDNGMIQGKMIRAWTLHTKFCQLMGGLRLFFSSPLLASLLTFRPGEDPQNVCAGLLRPSPPPASQHSCLAVLSFHDILNNAGYVRPLRKRQHQGNIKHLGSS